MAEDRHIISRKRVTDHGEVYTPSRIVNAMLDLVKQETERIESRFLEPACGRGNFLAEILERKLRVVGRRYRKIQLEYERNAVLAVSSIYGIDILEDNIQKCRQRLFGIFERNYRRLFSRTAKDACRESVRFILERNIIHGDARSLKTAGENPEPIIFSEWSPVNGNFLNRRDFRFSELLMYAAEPKQMSLIEEPEQLSFFSDLGEQGFLPTPVSEPRLIHFLELAHAGES
ncbi:MAG: N-6 DNA methylase [FCB group bacterium]|jgi:SAM-dependent methyltransferase|nr:N-6 DNA methylase [FCB group bacterium]